MSREEQQKKLLAILLAVLAVAILYRTINGLGDGGGRSGGGRRGAAVAQLDEVATPHLDLELLRREPASYAPGRDLFRYAPKAPPKPRPAARPAAPRPRPQPRPAVPAQAVARPATPPKPLPPQVSFRYLGSFGPPDGRIAVFVNGEEIHNAFAGDVLMERFIVDKIGFESADIGFVGFPDAPSHRLEAGK